MSLTQTKVEFECISKKEEKNWEQNNPIVTSIEIAVPYDQNSVYHKLSGGTNMVLRTINQDAADMFTIGKKYMMVIEPVADAPTE